MKPYHQPAGLAILSVGLAASVHARELSAAEKAFLEQLGRECPVVELWPGGVAPNETTPAVAEDFEATEKIGVSIRGVAKPSMVIIPPQAVKPTGVTLLLCPGGGYGQLGTKTAVQAAGWLNAMGATAVLLKYRVPPRSDDRDRLLPLSDAQRAMGLLRSRAAQWGIDARRLGIGGYSAGGHLAFNLACHADRRVYDPVDEHDKASCRPDFVVLHYAAYLSSPIESLTANPNLGLDRIAEHHLPPVFSTITRPDKFTAGCVNTLWALAKAKVPTELHVYPEGGHGGCLDKYPFMEFTKPLARFLKDHDILDDAAQQAGDAYVDQLIPTFRDQFYGALNQAEPRKTPMAASDLVAVPQLELSPGDAAIVKACRREVPVFKLWPDAGTRPDDPMQGAAEGTTYRGDVLRIDHVTCPTITFCRADQPDGRSVLVFPGGGYGILAADKEGAQIATWLNGQGITAFVVKYRVPRRKGLAKHAVALQDAQRAIRLVRGHAAHFGIDPARIGVLGFSAGGHLSALTCLQFNAPSYARVDDCDTVSCRPDFGVLVYPAYLYEGGKLDPLVAHPEINVTPPLYIAIAGNDRFMEGATRFLLQAREGRLSVECHVYEKGGHGQGMLPSGYPFSQWVTSCERWLTDLKHRL